MICRSSYAPDQKKLVIRGSKKSDGDFGNLPSTATMTPLDQDNDRLAKILHEARPSLIGVARAGDVIPALDRNLVLHAGPPVVWGDMVPAMREAIAGALLVDDRAGTIEEARALAAGGSIRFAPAHDNNAVGAMAGVITASMPVLVVRDSVSGIEAYAPINEGLGKALRFGANGPEVLERLRWIRDEFAPLLNDALMRNGPVDLKAHIAEALRRGDECHNRNKAATSAFVRDIGPSLVETGRPHADIARAMRFISGNDHFFLSLSIAHAKAVTLSMEATGGGSLVTTMAGNGREVGIRLSSSGKRWCTAPASVASIRLFPGRTIEEATPTMGDSYVTEVIGLGAFALAAAPAIAEFIGGTVPELIERSDAMRAITVSEHPTFVIPALGFRGVPSGIDVRKVVALRRPPIVNTGVASNVPGAGQIGAGVQTMPLDAFVAAEAMVSGRVP
jgi:hypothetical protein